MSKKEKELRERLSIVIKDMYENHSYESISNNGVPIKYMLKILRCYLRVYGPEFNFHPDDPLVGIMEEVIQKYSNQLKRHYEDLPF